MQAGPAAATGHIPEHVAQSRSGSSLAMPGARLCQGGLCAVGVTAALLLLARTAEGKIANLGAPLMGFSTWNQFGSAISEDLILQVADALESTGLRDAGYSYVNLDDAWGAEKRNATGHIVGDPVKFPHGMAWLGRTLHGKNLSFGLYTSRNVRTCSGKMPGSLHNEAIDAATFAAYGADFVKNDDCGVVYADAVKDYGAMQQAIAAVDRPMLHNVKAPDLTPATAPAVCQIKRVGKDLKNDWEDLVRVFDTGMSAGFLGEVGPGRNFYLDFDMLEVGNTNGGPPFSASVLTPTEQRAHFSLWAAAKSPLVLGNDPRNVTSDTLAVLTNREVIAVNQDPLGKPVRIVSRQAAPSGVGTQGPGRSAALASGSAGEFKLVLQACSPTDPLQRWELSGDGGVGQIRSAGRPGYCAGVYKCLSRWPWWTSATPCASPSSQTVPPPDADADTRDDGSQEATASPARPPPPPCAPENEQRWRWNVTADGAWTLEWLPASGKHSSCWGTPGSSSLCCLSTEGANPEVDTCGWPVNASQQRWRWQPSSGGAGASGGGSSGQLMAETGGLCLGFAGDLEVYAGPLSGGGATVVLFNRSPSSANVTVRFADLRDAAGFDAQRTAVRDLWAHRDLGVHTDAFTAFVESHGVVHVNLAKAQ